MTTELEATQNIRELGKCFREALSNVTGDDVSDKSDLCNGLAAYEMLSLKGQWDYIDESVDIILRIVYELVMKKLGETK